MGPLGESGVLSRVGPAPGLFALSIQEWCLRVSTVDLVVKTEIAGQW